MHISKKLSRQRILRPVRVRALYPRCLILRGTLAANIQSMLKSPRNPLMPFPRLGVSDISTASCFLRRAPVVPIWIRRELHLSPSDVITFGGPHSSNSNNQKLYTTDSRRLHQYGSCACRVHTHAIPIQGFCLQSLGFHTNLAHAHLEKPDLRITHTSYLGFHLNPTMPLFCRWHSPQIFIR